jgi:prepilin-type processing-associated H-X9-DG protein
MCSSLDSGCISSLRIIRLFRFTMTRSLTPTAFWFAAILGRKNFNPSWARTVPFFLLQGVWICPGVKSKLALFSSYGYNAFGYSAPGSGENSTSFGLGGHTLSLLEARGQTILKPTVVNLPVKEADIVSPSETMAIADGFEGSDDQLSDGQSLFWRETFYSSASFNTATVNARHQGKANVVFCDGHVESPTLKFLFADTSDAALSRWNRDHQPHRDRLAP